MSGAHLELKDKFGNVMRFGIGGDNWYPPFPLIQDHRQHITEVRHLELRPDDVLMEGFPKTGRCVLVSVIPVPFFHQMT